MVRETHSINRIIQQPVNAPMSPPPRGKAPSEPEIAKGGAHLVERPTMSSMPPICGSKASRTSRSIAKSLPDG
jgi:hypothetical protein